MTTMRSSPIHPAGWPFLAATLVLAAALWWLWWPLGLVGLVVAGYIAYFFRDPDRVTPAGAGLVISPADGKVQMITQVEPLPELGLPPTPHLRISVFLNIFNVHVNRMPVAGVVGEVAYRPGKFVNASFDKASEVNERMSIRLTTPDRRQIGVVQIAGLIARRIVCTLRQGQAVEAGERFGLIRFGSRVDVYLPEGSRARVALGQHVVAGETVIAELGAEGS